MWPVLNATLVLEMIDYTDSERNKIAEHNITQLNLSLFKKVRISPDADAVYWNGASLVNNPIEQSKVFFIN